MVDIELEVCCTLWGGEGRLQMRGSGRSVCLQGAGQTAAGGGELLDGTALRKAPAMSDSDNAFPHPAVERNGSAMLYI